MFRILLVDDEQIERDGVARLLRKHQFPFEILEAENGEEALALMEEEPVDILFTDIKMPFMDGLELSRQARERYGSLKIIIYSAYGEFAYAQQAIGYNIFAYLLKPVEVEEFLRVFTNVSKLCQEEKDRQVQEQQLRLGYQKGMEYERERMLLELVGDALPREGDGSAGFSLEGRQVQLVLVDFGQRFFDRHGQLFPEVIRQWVGHEFEYINLNENQSLLFILLPSGSQPDGQLGPRLKQGITDSYGERVALVIGRCLTEPGQLKDEYRQMEELLSNRFFYKESVVFYTDSGQGGSHSDTSSVSALMEPLYWHLNAKDYYSFRKGMEHFFHVMADGHDHSAVYIKYMCIELTKKLLETCGKESQIDFRAYVEGIFASRSLSDMRVLAEGVFTKLGIGEESGGQEYTKKVIKDILQLIEEHYMTDISLQWIADQVFLTQTYVSHLFSKEMGQTLVKYLTAVRMRKAGEALLRTNHTIAHISGMVGYPNDSYFGKIFKNHFGVSPAKYREQYG